MPFAQRLAARIVQLDVKLLVRTTARLAQVAERIEAFVASEADDNGAR
jgi:hypothetical protein